MYTTFDFSGLSGGQIYGLMASIIVPRPIAFISTMNPEGTVNLAPFSFYNAVSSTPPCLVFAISRKANGDKKHTLINIETSGEFVVNSTHEWLADQVNQTAYDYAHDESELDSVGLTAVASTIVKPPRVKEAMIQMECHVEQIVEIGPQNANASTLVIGRILCTHVADEILTEGKIDIQKYQPLSRLGGAQWGKTREVFELARPKK